MSPLAFRGLVCSATGDAGFERGFARPPAACAHETGTSGLVGVVGVVGVLREDCEDDEERDRLRVGRGIVVINRGLFGGASDLAGDGAVGEEEGDRVKLNPGMTRLSFIGLFRILSLF